MKKYVMLLLKVTISIGLLYLMFQYFDIDWKEVKKIRIVNGKWLWGVLLIVPLLVTFQALRWNELYCDETKPPVKEFFKFILVGYFFSILLPWSLGGDAIKAVAFGKRHNGVLKAFSGVLLGRVLGVTAFLLLFWCGFIISPDLPLQREIVVAAGVTTLLLLSIVLCLYFFPRFISARLEGREKMKKAVDTLADLSHRSWRLGALYSVGIQLCILTNTFILFKTVGAAITPQQVLLYIPLTSILLFLPISFAGLGVREISLVYFLVAMPGITEVQCVQSSMLGYCVIVTLALFGGGIQIYLNFKSKHGLL